MKSIRKRTPITRPPVVLIHDGTLFRFQQECHHRQSWYHPKYGIRLTSVKLKLDVNYHRSTTTWNHCRVHLELVVQRVLGIIHLRHNTSNVGPNTSPLFLLPVAFVSRKHVVRPKTHTRTIAAQYCLQGASVFFGGRCLRISDKNGHWM